MRPVSTASGAQPDLDAHRAENPSSSQGTRGPSAKVPIEVKQAHQCTVEDPGEPVQTAQALRNERPPTPLGELSKLPLEVRENIYGHLIGRPTSVIVDASRWSLYGSDTRQRGQASVLPAICYVNHQIFVEATLVYMRRATLMYKPILGKVEHYNVRRVDEVTIKTNECWLRLSKFLRSFMHHQAFKAVRSLRVDIKTLHASYECSTTGTLTLHLLRMFPGLKRMDVVVTEFDMLVQRRDPKRWAYKTWEEMETEYNLVRILSSGIVRRVNLVQFNSRFIYAPRASHQPPRPPLVQYVEDVANQVKSLSKGVNVTVGRERNAYRVWAPIRQLGTKRRLSRKT